MVSDFINRHIGLLVQDKTQMLEDLGLSSLDELVREIVPDSILFRGENLIEGCDENQALKELKEIASHLAFPCELINLPASLSSFTVVLIKQA